MSEKPESDEFEEEDAEDVAPGGEEVDVDHIMRDVDSQRRRAPKGAEPAWRRLERVMEERRTAELLSDFDDYEIFDGERDEDHGHDDDDHDQHHQHDADSSAEHDGAAGEEPEEEDHKARKKKKSR
jgi:hypothetical protein